MGRVFCFRRTKVRLLLPLVILAIVPLRADDAAAAILQQAAATVRSSKSSHFEIITDAISSGERYRNWTQTRQLYIRDAGGRVHYEFEGGAGPGYAVASDGKTVTIAALHLREYMRVPLNGPLLEMKGLGQEAAMALNSLRSAEQLIQRFDGNSERVEQIGTETVEMDGREHECAVVRVDYRVPANLLKVTYSGQTFWVDTTRHLILREEYVLRGTLNSMTPYAPAESRRTLRYVKAAVDQPVADSDFVYTPPPGFHEVDRLDRPNPGSAKTLIGQAAPALSLKTVDGEPYDFAGLRGHVALVYFWYPNSPCREQMQVLAKLKAKGADIVLLGVSSERTPEKAVDYLKGLDPGWTQLLDNGQLTWRTLYKLAMPQGLFIIDRDGKVADVVIGPDTELGTVVRASLAKLGVQIP